MATQATQSKETTTHEKPSDTGEAPEEKPKKVSGPPSPPPEKPLPDDCCGSGCTPCVWDVYYEQLEEYNKLYNIDSSDSQVKP